VKLGDLRLLLKRGGSRRLFITALFAAFFWSAILITNAFLIAEVITRIIDNKPRVTEFILALALLWIVRAVFQATFERWCTSQAIEIKRNVRLETTSNVASYMSVSPAEFSTILTKGLNSLDIYLGRFVPQLFFATVAPIAIIVTIFFKDTLSAVIAILTLPMIPLFGALIGRYSADSVARKWRTLGSLSLYFEDSLRGFATLKIFGRSKTQSERIARMGDKYTDETMKVLRVSFLSAFALELVATLSVAVIAVSVGLRLLSGGMEFKPALIILILAPEVYFPVRNAASLFHASEDGTAALHAIERVVGPSSSPTSQAHVNIKDVDVVSWPEWRFERNATDIVMVPAARVKRGEMLFISGESGIGKTTFANNLLGIAFSAQISFESDGTLRKVTPEMKSIWQKKLGWVPQNPQLASGTVRDQFTLLSASISDGQIVSALSSAGLELDDLTDGLDTSIGKGGEAGSAVSGGQIRRIAVARALIRKPEIIVADEPTADLDAVSAKAVMGALRRAQQDGAIVVCITHDKNFMTAEDQACVAVRVER
jgi:ABC-type transport system involved in cytochrome bd biosynthesis fused ATPase/permease subunit